MTETAPVEIMFFSKMPAARNTTAVLSAWHGHRPDVVNVYFHDESLACIYDGMAAPGR